MPRARRRLWLLCAVPLLLGACGIGGESSPHLIPEQQVPYHLLQPAPTTTIVIGSAEHVTIYLAGPQHLATVTRLVTEPATASKVLDALSRGPTNAEASTDLRSPLSTATPMSVVGVSGHLATVRLSGAFADLAGHDQIVAAAQLVYTLTAIPGINQVQVDIGGHPAHLPTDTGNLTQGPLTRADYASFAAP